MASNDFGPEPWLEEQEAYEGYEHLPPLELPEVQPARGQAMPMADAAPEQMSRVPSAVPAATAARAMTAATLQVESSAPAASPLLSLFSSPLCSLSFSLFLPIYLSLSLFSAYLSLRLSSSR